MITVQRTDRRARGEDGGMGRSSEETDESDSRDRPGRRGPGPADDDDSTNEVRPADRTQPRGPTDVSRFDDSRTVVVGH
jgi:hypothetical protein